MGNVSTVLLGIVGIVKVQSEANFLTEAVGKTFSG